MLHKDIFAYMQISTKYKKIFTKVHFGTATLDTTFREFTHTHTHTVKDIHWNITPRTCPKD